MKIKLLIFVLILGLIGTLNIVNATNAKVASVPTELSNLDSDKDGYSDLCEVLHKSNPQDKESTPKENITINVPSDIKTIQGAINASIDGDTIAVSQGKYKGNINFNGKTITLTSTLNQSKLDSGQADPYNSALTVIEGNEKGSVIIVDTNSTLKGFTITSPDLDCRGIYCKNASPTIENCTIIDNETTGYGGGIYINTTGSRPQITNCIITGNKDSSGAPARQRLAGGHESAQISGGTPQITQSWINGQGLVDNTTPTPETTETEIASAEPPTIETEDSTDTSIDTIENTNEDSPIILLSGSPVWYVDDNASDTGTGTSWEDAFKYLQDAWNDTGILPGDEIWVAQGTYKPDQGSDTDIIIPGQPHSHIPAYKWCNCQRRLCWTY